LDGCPRTSGEALLELIGAMHRGDGLNTAALQRCRRWPAARASC